MTKKYSNLDFKFLDDKNLKSRFIVYENKNLTIVKFYIPKIKCSSCIWVLENINKKNKNIIKSKVDINKKEIVIFKKRKYKLSDLALFLKNIGYEPLIKENIIIQNKDTIAYKLSISFFCFGNIMLLTLPKYLNKNNEDLWLNHHNLFFGIIIIILSLPVILISFNEYIQPSYLKIKNRIIDINILISLGMIMLLINSLYEILNNISLGYLDSFSGLIFFLFLGKYFLYKAVKIINFDKSYKNLYSICAVKIQHNKEIVTPISEIKKGDEILIKNGEIIPADSIIIKGFSEIDNSFITGESKTIFKKQGDKVYAGAKHNGQIIRLKIYKNIDKSYLSQLWKLKNKQKFKHQNSTIDLTNKYFIIAIFFISILTGCYWCFLDPKKIIKSISYIFIVTCPCALVIAPNFTLGYIIKILSRVGFIINDINVIENIYNINYLIFDKTGTITEKDKFKIKFIGKTLTKDEKQNISILMKNSNHPLSNIIYQNIKETYNKCHNVVIQNFKEIPGKGLIGEINDMNIKIGSHKIMNFKKINNQTQVYVSINNIVKGYFLIKNYYRKNLTNIFKQLNKYNIMILSGDNDLEKKTIQSITNFKQTLFNKNPIQKLKIIKKLQQHYTVMMFGDGLNDICAIKQSNVGVIVNQNNNFIPECDIILNYDYLDYIPKLLKISTIGVILVRINLLISIIYNIVGIILSIKCNMSPIILAILMPLSSISVIIFAFFSTKIIKIYFKT